LPAPGEPVVAEFPVGFQAYWIRVASSVDARASAQLDYR
jgi:hypothetical protein